MGHFPTVPGHRDWKLKLIKNRWIRSRQYRLLCILANRSFNEADKKAMERSADNREYYRMLILQGYTEEEANNMTLEGKERDDMDFDDQIPQWMVDEGADKDDEQDKCCTGCGRSRG